MKRKIKKNLERLANLRLRDMRFAYDVAEDILKDSCLRFYNEDNIEILDAKKLRLNRI
jgi:hypothetical protein